MRRPELPWPGRRPALIAGVASALLLAAAAPAAATTFCVGFERAGCESRSTAADAFADALDGDRIELGDVQATTPLDDTGRSLEVVGSGEGISRIEGGLTLADPGSTLTAVTVHDLTLGGAAGRVEVVGTAELRGAARLQGALVRNGGIDAAADGTPQLDTVVIVAAGGPGLRVRCGATLRARQVTLTGTPGELVQTDCATSAAQVGDSILWGPPAAGFAGPGRSPPTTRTTAPSRGAPTGPATGTTSPGSPRAARGSPPARR